MGSDLLHWQPSAMVRKLALQILFMLVLSTADASTLSLKVADIAAPDFSAHGIVLTLDENGSADLRIVELRIKQSMLSDVRFHCSTFTLSTAGASCRGGILARLPGMALDFDYRFGTEHWQISARLHNVAAKQLANFLPPAMPPLNQGKLSGTLHASGDHSGAAVIEAALQLADVGFSDASGLHAAEKLRGNINLSAERKADLWKWQGDIAWQSGELFWQPLFLAGGHSLNASGSFDGALLNVEQATINLPEIGHIQLAAAWNVRQGELAECTAHGSNLALGKLFTDYAKPYLAGSSLAQSFLYGNADVDWQYRDGATKSLRLALRDGGIADAERRFALLGVNSEVDWQADAPRTADIAFGGGALLGVPLGNGQWTVQMHGMDFSIKQGTLPILDGGLELRDFRLYREKNAWRWQFAAALKRISMEQFSQMAGWPRMSGMIEGSVPKVSYDGSDISVDGTIRFDVFDGTVTATQLRLADPFGRTPHLSGSLTMRELDLAMLTKTFSFGNMQGRIDVDVNDLELQDWRPASFDARIASSAGRYPRKISQRAVQNISALGGAGAAAAIQRSFLHFFENFGYDRIGWSCVLRNGVCRMGGVEGGNSGTYTIVRGSGIPAITVMGYNRNVSWDELLTRVKRVTQDNMQAVVK